MDNNKPDIFHPVKTGLLWWLSVTAIGFLGMLLALGAPFLFGQGVKAGDVAQRDLIAPRSLVIEDAPATAQARERAAQLVLPVFKRDHSRDGVILGKLAAQLDEVAELQAKVGLPLAENLKLSPRQQVYLLESPDEVFKRITAHVLNGEPADSAGTVEPYVETETVEALRSLGPAQNRGSKRAASAQLDPLTAVASARQSFGQLGPRRPAFTHDLLSLACSIKPRDLPQYSRIIQQATRRLLQVGTLFPGVPQSDWQQTALEFLPDSWEENARLASARVMVVNLEPTVTIDLEATRAKAEAARNKVAPIMRTIEAGQLLAQKGSVITAEQVRILGALGMNHPDGLPMLGSLFFSLMAAFLLLGVFMHSYEPKHLYSPSSIGLMATVCIVTCSIAAFIGQDHPQFVPLPAAVLVLTIFISPRVAVAILVTLLIFFWADGLVGVDHLIALGLASTVAVGTNIKQRKDLMFRGFLIGVVQAGGYLLAAAATQSLGSAGLVARDLSLQILGGLSSCIVAIGSLPFLENLFGMVTQFRLAELTDSTQPLLRQLEENAPGTYQHSLAVANLAEAGGRAIGADVNLIRAGSLYHDIGKMVRPRYFIENQLGDRNPHDGMTPEESRDRVLAHVTDGLELAHKYALPKLVQDFIPQHQGTTLMAYFYHKAVLRDGAANVDQAFYRYPGPKPQSREAAIVMLADVSEAVTHSMKDPSEEEVEAAMATVFRARWDDGQFLESGLTADELERVKKAFVRVWRTLHHERLKYPSTTTGRMAVPPEPPPQPSPISHSSDKN